MAGPPKDVEPSALWLKLQERPWPSEVVDFPARDASGATLGQVRIRVLPVEEHTAARIRAHNQLKAKVESSENGSEILRETLGDLVAKEVLAVACVDVEPISEHPPVYRRLFANGDDVVRVLSADELATLFSQYMLVQQKYGPREDLIGSPEELDAWIKRLAEGGESFPLALMHSHHLVALAFSLAERAYSLSAVLEYLQENSPDTLVSALESLGTGTSWSGKLPAGLTEIGSNPSVESSETEPKRTDPDQRAFTMSDAIAMAQELSGRK